MKNMGDMYSSQNILMVHVCCCWSYLSLNRVISKVIFNTGKIGKICILCNIYWWFVFFNRSINSRRSKEFRIFRCYKKNHIMVEMIEKHLLQWYVKEEVPIQSTRSCLSVLCLVQWNMSVYFVWEIIGWLHVIGALKLGTKHTTIRWMKYWKVIKSLDV